MNTSATEIILSPRCFPFLRDLADDTWAQLVDQVNMLEPYHTQRLAFELLIVHWCGCVNCQADSYRAMQGCVQCAIQAVRRMRNTQTDLLVLFTDAMSEIETYMENKV